jgi:predicted RNase H-like HicB family nuclease
VTIAGKPSDDFCARHVEQYFETGCSEGAALMRYAIVIEKAEGNYSAYVPDLPGYIATGDTVQTVEREIRDAIRFHIDGLKEDGLPVPPLTSSVEYVETWLLSGSSPGLTRDFHIAGTAIDLSQKHDGPGRLSIFGA